MLDKSGETEEVFRDFIESCLTIDPAIRMTPEQALEHPWLTGNFFNTNSPGNLSKSTMFDTFSPIKPQNSKR